MGKRNKIEIVYDVLKVIQSNHNSLKTTHILSKANLSHNSLKPILEELENKDLIESFYDKKHKLYKVTQKGSLYIEELKKIKKFMNIFEI